MSVEPKENVPRELLVVYTNAPDEPDLVLAGVTTDNGVMGLFNGAMEREQDAWLLHKLGILPEWWRLITSIHAVNLTGMKDQIGYPEEEADDQLTGLTHRERAALRRGWTVVSTTGGGRIYRLPDRLLEKYDLQDPVIRDPRFLVLVEQVAAKAPVVGPFEQF